MACRRDSSRLRLRDQLAEALNSLVERPGRTFLNGIGIAIGVATAVAVFTIADTAGHEVSATFDTLKATQILVKVSPEAVQQAIESGDSPFPKDAEGRVNSLAGVRSSGVTTVRMTRCEIAANDVQDPTGANEVQAPLISATKGALVAAEVDVTGKVWNAWHEQNRAKVALVGRVVAEGLKIDGGDPSQAVLIEGVPFVVAGVINESNRDSQLLRAVVVPELTGSALWPVPEEPPRMLVRTEPGAAQAVAAQAPVAIRPESPESFSVADPPDPKQFRESVEADVTGLYIALSAISLALGGVGIANTTLLMVMERSKEFGLRRAVGARPVHILRHVLTDTGLLGFLSGGIGVAIGIAVVLVVAGQRGWQPVMDPRIVLAGPIGGMVVGVTAGFFPALRARRIEPSDALRS
ncbi:MAG: ABC transporter permease [Microthrixaceae bacterium]